MTLALVAALVSARAGSPADPREEQERPDQSSTTVHGGECGLRAASIEADSEFALAETRAKLYLLGGHPASRQTVRTVQTHRHPDPLPARRAFVAASP